MFSKKPHCQYNKNQLADVICQLRFPEILSINANQPVDLQEAIRGQYPKFSTTMETPAPKITGMPGNLQLENQPSTKNYQFTSLDGNWRVNLTSTFISIACNRYPGWEEFAKKLDVPLAAFIKIYRPACFERIGLRYLNFISREALALQDVAFRQLIASPYLGLLADPDISEPDALRSAVDTEIALPGGCRLKLHAGPGLVKQNGQQQKEVKFIFDQDLYMTGNIPVNYSAGALETLHSHAFPIFRGAITDMLHEALEPLE
jgi:uncharacterized protein (TIGR04255 family)